MDATRRRLPRRLLPVVLAALMAASGCVAVAPAPGRPSPHPSLAPAAATPAVELAEASQPTGRWALTDTGPDRPHTHRHNHGHGQDHDARGRQLPPSHRQAERTERRAAAEPVAPPRRRHPAAAPKRQRPAAPRRTHRPEAAATYDMRSLCRAAADNQVNATLVDLCQDTYGH